MKNHMSDLYFCHECKELVRDLSELFFVEENSTNGFCSETCIERFYKPLVDYFESYEIKVFDDLNLEKALLDDESQVLEEALKRPLKIFQWSNQLYTKITHFFANVNDKNVVVTCFLYEGSASFIIGLTYHSDERIFDYFKKGEEKKVLLGSEEQVSSLSQEQIEFIEQKKGEFLAKVLENHSELDIGFESYPLYEKYVSDVLENPDFKKRQDSNRLGDIYLYSKIIIEDNRKVFLVIANLESKSTKGLILFVPSIYSEITNLFFEQDNFIKN